MDIRSLLLVGALTASLSTSPLAWSGEASGHVESLIVRSSDGLIYVWLNGTAVSRPACAASTDYWMIKDENSETGKKTYAALLAAQISGRPIRIVGSGTCTRWSDGEDISYIQLRNT